MRPRKYKSDGSNISIYINNEAKAKLISLSLKRKKTRSEIINKLIIDEYDKENAEETVKKEVSNILYNMSLE